MVYLAGSGVSFEAEWHPTKNGNLSPYIVTLGSEKTVWWLCGNSHEWAMSPKYRSRGFGCPVCVSFGFLKPVIASEWHPSLNGDKTPFDFRANSGVKVWWLGKECNHEWDMDIRSRVRDGYNCPFCVNQRILVGFNDLATTHPAIASEWHPTKNSFTAEQVSYGSKKKVWWFREECGHEWEAAILPRAVKGVGCGVCRGLQINVGSNDLAVTYPHIAAEWHPTENTKTINEITHGSHYKAAWLCGKTHSWVASVHDRVRGNGCPHCSAANFVSASEKELADYVSSLSVTVRTSVRNVIRGELDIFVPEKNIAVEFNGLYWHSEANGKGKNYHYDKWKQCQDKGIQLIQVWEDEWNRNPEQIKTMLAHKLGVSSQRKVYARKLVPVVLEQGDVNVFLNVNHVQGAVEGSIRVGLIDPVDESVVAVMVLKREPGSEGKVLNLLRFATSGNVVGGFTKLLRFAGERYAPESIVTFSDNCVSDGGLYESNGFVVAGVVRPDYKYLVKGERVHKFGYRLKRFRNDPELFFEEGLSERELAGLNGLFRVWDAGKTKWVYTF